jgi:predicted small metal-binding protein
MKTLSCNCGFSVTGENKYKVEAEMWHHAIHQHADMLKSMTPEMLEQWLVNKDKQLKEGA